MFNFNSDMFIDGIGDAESLAVLEKQMSAVASIATAAAVNSPVVAETPTDVAPSEPAVQQVVENTIQAVAPVVAPNIPANVLSDFGKFITKEVVASPEVKAADVGEVLPLEVFTEIVQNAVDAATSDKNFTKTVTETVGTAVTPTAPYYDITKGMMVNPDGTAYVAPKAAPVPSATPATAEDVGLVQGAVSPTATTTAGTFEPARFREGEEKSIQGISTTPAVTGSAESGTIGAFRVSQGLSPETGTTAVSPDQAAINAGLVFGAGAPGAITGGGVTGGTAGQTQTGVTEYIKTQLGGSTQPTAGGAAPTGPTATTVGGGTPTAQPGRTYTASDGTQFTDVDAFVEYEKLLEGKRAIGQSAYALLFSEFERYGLGGLVEPLRNFISQGLSSSEFTMKLRETDAYKKRFGANQQRIAKGLRALSEAEYIGLEDQYQNIMRQYGLPESYYTRGDMGRQEGFEKFIAGDVSPSELEDRVATAQNRIIYANPEVSIALKNFYPDISNGDLLAYALDPDKALAQIKRRISAAEIGASAVQLGLTTSATDAEYLARYGVTKEQAQQGYRSVAEVLPRASFLGEVYGKQGMGPYTQQTAEREVFNVPGAAEAAAQRRKLTELEQAQFSGRAGTAGGALARERAGGF